MHRLLFHQGERRFVIERASLMLVAGLFFLALALVGAVALITDLLYQGIGVVIAPSGVALTFIALWFAAPLIRRARG